MIKVDCEQNSQEWLDLKAGVPSASNFDKIITTQGKPSKQREKYMYQLAGERVAGIKADTYQSAAMERGIELEQEAADMYDFIKGVSLEKVGICYKDEKKKVLCSPDRLAGPGLVEIKCPLIHTHVQYLLENKLPTTYIQQVQGQLYITGLEWCDFVSYFGGLRPLIIRVNRDDFFIEMLADELEKFCADLEGIVEKIR